MNKWEHFTTDERLVILAALADYQAATDNDQERERANMTARGLFFRLADAIYDSETA